MNVWRVVESDAQPGDWNMAVDAALMESADNCVVPIIEERFMACLLPLLAAVVVAQEIGLNPSTLLWLAVNFATAGAVMIEWRRATRLQTYQPQATHQ